MPNTPDQSVRERLKDDLFTFIKVYEIGRSEIHDSAIEAYLDTVTAEIHRAVVEERDRCYDIALVQVCNECNGLGSDECFACCGSGRPANSSVAQALLTSNKNL